ncbi:MAG TPA: T9SS type A sorting domain-containing protein, partial [Bacteroidota bacterium]|nr:T9SS type A sorting domain-containing protein [Bacteroidota bacterium]
NATGTVWFDNFIFVGRTDWAGQNWNGFADADSGWQYWIAPNGGNDGKSFFPGSGVVQDSANAHSGKYALKITAPVGRDNGELIFFTETVPIPANSKDKQYVLSAWVKTSGIKKDSILNADYALGFTWTYHTGLFGDATGFLELGGGGDMRFALKDTSSGWTQYSVLITIPNNDVRAISVRPRSWPKWTGVSYWDDFSFNAIDNAVPTSVRPDFNPIVGGVPLAYSLEQNYPNPFNPSTRFRFSLPQAQRVSVKIYDVIGREVAVLAQDLLQAGTYTLEWNAAKVPSGVYFYRLEAGDFSAVKKMLLLK